MKLISIFDYTGTFAENKDVASNIRIQEITQFLDNKEEVILDFEKVDMATQAFIHALISDILRKFGNDALDYISFKSCNETIEKIINIVVEYMQEGL